MDNSQDGLKEVSLFFIEKVTNPCEMITDVFLFTLLNSYSKINLF